jgi:2-amino-4-hydroxy-6-hydroxymethyldihydropteridine diphosphokinase
MRRAPAAPNASSSASAPISVTPLPRCRWRWPRSPPCRAPRLVASSALYRTAPVEAQGPDFVNAVAELRSTLEPAVLLAAMQAIERRHGRQRPYRNAPRTLDLDLLLYGERCIAQPGLEVPHPRMHLRAFVLAPLAELAPEVAVGRRGRAAVLLAALAGQRIERV